MALEALCIREGILDLTFTADFLRDVTWIVPGRVVVWNIDRNQLEIIVPVSNSVLAK